MEMDNLTAWKDRGLDSLRRNDEDSLLAALDGLRDVCQGVVPDEWILGEPLFLASSIGSLNALVILIDAVGGSITTKQYGAFTAACVAGHLDVAEYLLMRGVRSVTKSSSLRE